MSEIQVKHLIAAVAAAALLAATAFVGSGYLHTRRTERDAAELRAAVHAMSVQDLGAAIARCDAPLHAAAAGDGGATRAGESRDAARRDAAYCEDVARESDDRPLEIVNVEPPDAPAPR